MNLIDALQSANVPFKRHGDHHHASRGWVNLDCVRCSPGWGKYRLGFEIATGRAHCWTCGAVNGVAVLAEICKISLREAAAILKHPSYTEREPEHQGKLVLPKSENLLPVHRQYLEGRGFDPDEISKLWGVSGIGIDVKLAWRLLIPIHDRYGRIVSWTTRSISKTNPRRYVSAASEEEAVPHKDLLYGHHLARHVAVIVEGPLDAWAIGPGGVATCGVSYSQSQMSLMGQFPIRIVCFDSQPDAQKRADKLCRNLSVFSGMTENVILETGKDPAEADKAEIEELRNKFLSL